MSKKIAIVVGTRPEIIKMSPIIRECERLGLDYFILHTGQHYDFNLDGVFFEQLKLPRPRYNLGVGSGTYAEEVSKTLLGVEKILIDEKPSILLVEGDTNACIGAGLAASKCGVPIGHIEAGLRSYFSGMVEEINRVVVDHISQYLFAPTDDAASILWAEGIPESRVFVTGNTIVDAVLQNTSLEKQTVEKDYILATVHRRENVDNRDRYASILEGLKRVSKELGLPVIYPIHPGARKMLLRFDLDADGIRLCEPVDYQGFLGLEKHAKLVLTDSGGCQEECCILGTPCVTLRDNTERPETVEVGANILAGASADDIVDAAKVMIERKGYWRNPFGDGKAAEKIVEIIRKQNV